MGTGSSKPHRAGGSASREGARGRGMILGAAIMALCLAAALVVVGHVIGGRPRTVWRSTQTIFALESDDEGLFWLAKSDPEASGGSLFAVARGRQSPRVLYRQERLIEMALAGESVLALEADGQAANLLLIPRDGGQPTALARGLRRPGGLAFADGVAYWTETRPALAAHVRHIPVLQFRTWLRACSTDGQGVPRTIGVAEAAADDLGNCLLGVGQGSVYWLHVSGRSYGLGWSALRSVSVNGGRVETAVLERGTQVAILEGDDLYWTAPSEDAGDPRRYRCVRRGSPPRISSVTITDWLMAEGALFALDGRIYYAAPDGIWAVPPHLGEPRLLKPVGSGSAVVTGFRGSVYQALASEGGGSMLLRRPVVLRARLRAAVGLP